MSNCIAFTCETAKSFFYAGHYQTSRGFNKKQMEIDILSLGVQILAIFVLLGCYIYLDNSVL